MQLESTDGSKLFSRYFVSEINEKIRILLNKVNLYIHVFYFYFDKEFRQMIKLHCGFLLFESSYFPIFQRLVGE